MAQEPGHVPQWHHVGSVAPGDAWIEVRFHEEAVDARSGSGAGQVWDKLPLAAGTIAQPTGELHTVCGIENYGRELAHDGQAAHVDD
jgi:hypothetical protein